MSSPPAPLLEREIGQYFQAVGSHGLAVLVLGLKCNSWYNWFTPTFLRIGSYRFFCYSGDRDEPPHIHVVRDQEKAKFWLSPVRLQTNQGFSRTEINRLQNLVAEHQEQLLEGWHDFFEC